MLGRAVELLPANGPARRELLPELGHALTEAGELERAQDVLSAAIAEAAAAGDARLEAFARVRRAYVGTFTGEKLKAALVEAQAAASALERFDDQAMLAQAHWAVGVFHFWLGDCAGADRALRRALDHARRGGRSRDEGEVLSSLVMVARHGAHTCA